MKAQDTAVCIKEIEDWCGTARNRLQFIKRLAEFFRPEEVCLILRAADKSKLV